MRKRASLQRRYLAPKLTISQQQPWFVKLGLGVLLVVVVSGLAWWTYALGKSFAFGPRVSQEKLDNLQQQVEQISAERDKLQRDANTIDSKLNIDRSTQKELADQVKALTAENQKLKDDLAFFEGLMPSGTGMEGIAVQNLKLEQQGPGQVRYRGLVMQGVKSQKDFQGEAQLQLNLVQGGKPVTMLFPDPKAGDAGKLKLSFRHYQRVDGVIPLPDGAIAKSAQLRVLDRGQIRAQQTVNISQ